VALRIYLCFGRSQQGRGGMYSRLSPYICGFVAILILTACAFEGGPVNPLQRKLSWYSYLNADDLRASCQVGHPDQARLVYNAIHTEQIRTYEISSSSYGDGAATLDSRVLGPASFAKLADGILGPWLGDTSTTTLRPEDAQQFWASMEASDAFGPAPAGLYLESGKFFWLTAACRDGQFYYNAFVWPSDSFDAIQFADRLFAWDMTGVAVNPPRNATNLDIYGDASPTRKSGAHYQVTIAQNGLRGF